jgi:hypothetical protein
LAGHSANGFGKRTACLECRGDVEDDEFVDPFGVVSPRQFCRIAGRSESFEVDPFHHLSAANVETGDDSFGEHDQPASRTKFRSIVRPTSPDFSG